MMSRSGVNNDRLNSADISRIEPGRSTSDESLSERLLRYGTV